MLNPLSETSQQESRANIDMREFENERPQPQKIAHTVTGTIGDKRLDHYYWMNQRDSSDVLAHLKSEQNYYQKVTASMEPLRRELFEELKAKIHPSDETPIYRKGDYFYQSKYESGQDYRKHVRKKTEKDAPEEILLDENILAKGHKYFSLGSFVVSPDQMMVAYTVDTVGREKYDVYILDLKSKEITEIKELKELSNQVIWGDDQKSLYYLDLDDQLIPNKLFHFDLESKKSVLLYEEKDKTFYMSISKSLSERFLFVGQHSTDTDEYHYLDLSTKNPELKLFRKREQAVNYDIDDSGSEFYVRTNKGAINFKMMTASYQNTADWQEFLPYDEKRYLLDFLCLKDFLILEERYNGNNLLRILPREDRSNSYEIAGATSPGKGQEELFSATLSTNLIFDTSILRYAYSSFTAPTSFYDFNLLTHQQDLVLQKKVMGDYNEADYESKRLWVDARDGAKIPVSLIFKKGTDLNTAHPLYLYGYGSYGHTIDPFFTSNRLSLLDRGFVYAIAHVRGSTAMGRQWYLDGRQLNKKNTFYDFIDVGTELVKQGMTTKSQLFAEGRSAGGLLMGAVANMAPDLFKGIVAGVPFVDVVTTMLDDSIPLTTFEYDEWGNPNKKDFYEYMLSYSPVDQVRKQNYPHILVSTGYSDPRVQYFEPSKWVAYLREANTNPDSMIVFDINMDTGHFGGSGRYTHLKDIARDYAFAIYLASID